MGAREGRKRLTGSRPELAALFEETVALYLRLQAAAAVIYGRGELSGPRRTVLLAIARSGPVTVAELARARAQSRQRLQPLVNALVTEKLVKLVTNPRHKRSQLVTLTAAGRRLVRTISRLEARLRSELPGDVAPRRLADAAATLRRVRAILESPATRATLADGVRKR